jgi:hypothetical protein
MEQRASLVLDSDGRVATEVNIVKRLDTMVVRDKELGDRKV